MLKSTRNGAREINTLIEKIPKSETNKTNHSFKKKQCWLIKLGTPKKYRQQVNKNLSVLPKVGQEKEEKYF